MKPHGLRGEVIVSLSTNREERVAAGSVLTTDDGRELLVLRSSPHQGRFIVTFEGVDGIDAAEGHRGARLSAPPIDDPDALWVHELIGAGSRTQADGSSARSRAWRPIRPVTCWCSTAER